MDDIPLFNAILWSEKFVNQRILYCFFIIAYITKTDRYEKIVIINMLGSRDFFRRSNNKRPTDFEL